MLRVALVVVGMGLLLSGCGSAGLSVAAPHFRTNPGWHVGSRSARSCPGVSRTRCTQAEGWAATVAYRDCGDCVGPHRTLAALPQDGVVIQLLNGREQPSRARPASWPPRLVPIEGPFEGVPARYGLAEGSGRTGTVEWSLYVWFGRAQPTRRQLARATAELRTAGP